jgi:hypothetical protein
VNAVPHQYNLKPGCIIACGDHRWKVYGCHIGALGQEDLIHVESLTHSPGWTGEWESHPMLFIPLVLLQGPSITVPQPENRS